KAAQLHMSRLNAAELGAHKIRVNVVNPDAVISDSNIWAGGWAEGRAKAYGVKVEELPAFYAKRTLLNEVILPEDIANASFVLVSGLLSKSTGNVLNVDGGVARAFVREDKKRRYVTNKRVLNGIIIVICTSIFVILIRYPMV